MQLGKKNPIFFLAVRGLRMYVHSIVSTFNFTMILLSSYPNNPNGVKREPLTTIPGRVIMDMVYYWPMYTEIDQTMDKPIMIFSRYSGVQ